YRILEELGQGGMGAVYKALHTKLDRVVAIKILSRGRSGDQRAIARFEREMKAVGRFDHPHIVRAYDAREIGGAPVLIMEFVEGMDLGRLVQRLGPIPMAEACELVRQACLGLQYVHEQGLVHRDIKPSNLMLTPQGIVKILDLGLARFHFEQSEEEMTNSGQAMGTADYMAPEQASDSHAVDIRADIYSLGCTLYKLLAGFAPFEGSQYKGTFEKMTAHVQRPAPPIEKVLPEIPRELAAVVEKMLAKAQADRFAQPSDVIEALAPFCANAALPALLTRATEIETDSPLSLRERARVRADQVEGTAHPATKPIRRRRFILVAIGLLLFVLGFGFGFSLGIIVTINKDGKTTAIKVPDGSNVQVNEQGNVTVDMNKNKETTGQYAPIVPNTEQPVSKGKKSEQRKQRFTVDMTPVPDSYRLSPGDSLVVEGGMNAIKHFGESNGGIIVIEPDGTITFDKIFGPIKVEGLTLDEAEFAAKKRIKEVCFNPEISIKLIEDEKTSTKQSDSQSHLIAVGDKVDIRISVTPDSKEFHEECTIDRDAVMVDKKGYGDGTWKITGITLKEAEKKLLGILRSQMNKNPYASITLVNLKNKDQNQPEFHSVDLSTSDGKAAVPPEPYTIMSGDSLVIRAMETIPEQPVDGIYVVEPAGTVPLPPAYGRVNIKGLSLVEAEAVIVKHLQQILRQPLVSVTLSGWVDRSNPQAQPEAHRIAPGDILDIWANGTIPAEPIHGPYLVEPDGQVSLGPGYGRVNLKGQTFEEAEASVLKQLQQILRQPEVSITLGGWRKERKTATTAEDNSPRKRTSTSGKAQPQARINPRVENTPLPPFEISTPWPRSELEKYLSPVGGEQEVNKPSVPIVPGLPPEARGSGLSTGKSKKDDGRTASPAPGVSPVAELKALQGQWKVVHIGKEKDAEFPISLSQSESKIAVGDRFIFANERMRIVNFESGSENMFSYGIDPTATPKTIDLYRWIGSGNTMKEELTSLGIYEIDRDELKFCLIKYLPSLKTEQRPKSFTVDPGSDNAMITLQRYHLSDDEKAIKGSWNVVNHIEDGKPVYKTDIIRFISELSFANPSMYSRTTTPIGGQFEIDSTKQPGRINLFMGQFMPEGSVPFVIKQSAFSGIYKIDGDQLLIAYRKGGSAPEKFESATGSGITLLELRKSEPKKEEQAEPKPSGQNPPGEKTEEKKTQD
ncbi:MAG: polysaccharide biosynthesis/export family protein, partial [Thermoguttaceae bacterium]